MMKRTNTTQGYCLQDGVMSEAAQEQAAVFCTHYLFAMQQLVPPVYPQCTLHPTYLELKIPDNQVCAKQTLDFLKNSMRNYPLLCFATLPGKLVLSEQPPAFHSPCWLRVALFLNVSTLLLAHFIAFDRLTFL